MASVAGISQPAQWGSKWEQREVRADNIDFGQHPENNQVLDGDEACKVLIAAHFFILMF